MRKIKSMNLKTEQQLEKKKKELEDKDNERMKNLEKLRVFSTENEEQYETIGAFWDEMSNI